MSGLNLGETANVIAQSEKPYTLALDDESGEPYLQADGSPVSIDIIGEDSKTYKRRHAELERTIRKDPGWGDTPRIDRTLVIGAMAGVVGWSGVLDKDGNPAEPNVDNMRELFKRSHILQQALVGIRQHASFLAKS